MAVPYYQILESQNSQPIDDLSLISHEISGNRRCVKVCNLVTLMTKKQSLDVKISAVHVSRKLGI